MNDKEPDSNWTKLVSPHPFMTSGQGEAQEQVYKKVQSLVGKSVYYVPVGVPNPADNIQVDNKEFQTGPFQGYGGATLGFKLEDGTTDDVKGPWHTNSWALFYNTGFDIRDKHHGMGVIAEYKSNYGWADYVKGIILRDNKWIVGTFSRVEKLVAQVVLERKKKLWFISYTNGGSSSCWMDVEQAMSIDRSEEKTNAETN